VARYTKGKSGNPAGRKRGTRNFSALYLDRLGQDAAGEVVDAVIGKARAGDLDAAKLLLARVWPPRRGRAVCVRLPPITTAADLPVALAAVVQAVAAGALTPDEASAIANVLEVQRRAVETAGLDARVTALEEAAGGTGH
jgi:Family of unknown function (DUF5681)